MGVVKKGKHEQKEEKKVVKNVANGKTKSDGKVKKKKKTVSCLQCIKSPDSKEEKNGGVEGKYRVAAPELMQDTFMSDSEDEGGEVECPIQQQQQYRYMNSEAGTLHRAKPLEDSVTDGHLWPSNNDKKMATIDRQPLDIGFLVSFVVDARGGAMVAKRRGGARIIVPPAACQAPTRVTCRAASKRAQAATPPPLMEGEALASRLLELQPQGAKFLAPVIIEVPVYTAACAEREIVVLRSDTGDTWQDHYLHNHDNPLIQEALSRERQLLEGGEALGAHGERVVRVVTCDFPHYLACVSRVRQEVHVVGPDGGVVSSAHTPLVQALFPPQALTKRIRVGLQAHSAPAALQRRLLPRLAAVAPVLTVEPRRRKFHRSITLTAPLPAQDGKPDKSGANLRLLCSIMGGQARAVWEDVTGSTPLTVTDNAASFTTTVSARFWLMSCQNVADATKLATELYREMLVVPFEARLLVLGKRLDALEGRLLVLYVTDRAACATLLQQEHYSEVAQSTAVTLLDSKPVFLEFSGNLVPVTKSGTQPSFTFEAFKDNRVEFTVRLKHPEEKPAGRVYFMSEPKVAKGEQSQTPTCVLDVQLPERIAPRAGQSHADCLNLDQSGFDALHDELTHWGEHNSSIPPPIPTEPQLNGHDKIITITNGDVKHPSTERDQPKPQLNGNGPQVDSNKTKATFDSDEDKTPMNTLEKGEKGKKEKGFFGGIAGKVKNVFSHSEEQDDKESSPKPKQRGSKEKSPPKPAPRIINEELLDKVDDMFKDLKTAPPKDDLDIEDKIYATKLVVEEDRPTQDELYAQYANMQPVETPIQVKLSDPFTDININKCCDKKYKHTHDETSNLVDRIENVKFTANEKLTELGDRAQDELNDGLNKLNKEKDNVKQTAEEIKADAEGKIKDAQEQIKEKASDVQTKVGDEVDNVKMAANNVKEDLEHKAHVINFLAAEQAESLKNREHEIEHNLKQQAQKAAQDVSDAAHKTEDKLNQKAQDLKTEANEKLQEVSDAVEDVKEKTKSKAKKKGKEGKGFLTGLVNNIFGEKDKIEKEVKGKIAEGKDAANNLAEQAAAKKEEVKETVSKKKDKLKEDAEHLAQSAEAKKNELEKAAQDKVDETKKAVQDKKDEVEKAAKDTKDQIEKAVHDKTQEVAQAAQDTKEQVEKTVHDTTQQAVKAAHDTKDQIEKTVQDKTSEVAKAAQDKKEELESAAQKKVDEAKDALHKTKEGLIEVGDAIHDKASEAKQAVTDKKNEVEQAVQNKAAEIKEGAENLAHSAQAKKEEVGKAVHDTADHAKQAVVDKKNEIVDGAKHLADQASAKKDELQDGVEHLVQSAKEKKVQIQEGIEDKTHEIGAAISNTTQEVGQKIKSKKDDAESAAASELERIRHEAELATDEIKRSAEEALNSAADKKAEVQAKIGNKVDELQKSGKEGLEDIQRAASERASDLQQSSRQAAGHAQDSALGALDDVESAARDAVAGARDTWEDLHSSTRDTFADFKDDVHGLESSAQDTLHSFQSSAGNTFDSLDDSAKEFVGGVHSAAENSSKELFGDAKDAFEGFKVSADNKLEDVSEGVNERLEGASERLAAGAAAAAREADHFASNLNDLGNSVFGASGKGFMKDSSTKLLESEKSQASPSPQKKSSGIPKLKRKGKK